MELKFTRDVGTEIDRYEIREIFGIGGFGVTSKAWDHKLNWFIAKKRMGVKLFAS